MTTPSPTLSSLIGELIRAAGNLADIVSDIPGAPGDPRVVEAQLAVQDALSNSDDIFRLLHGAQVDALGILALVEQNGVEIRRLAHMTQDLS